MVDGSASHFVECCSVCAFLVWESVEVAGGCGLERFLVVLLYFTYVFFVPSCPLAGFYFGCFQRSIRLCTHFALNE